MLTISDVYLSFKKCFFELKTKFLLTEFINLH